MSTRGGLVDTRLTSRTREIPDPRDLLRHLGAGGFAWLHDAAGFVTAGVAARIPVGPGRDQVADAASAVTEALGSVAVDDPLAFPGTGPLAVGALPFAGANPAELVVPARVVGRTGDGVGWVTEIEGAPSAAHRPRLSPRPATETPSRFTIHSPRSRAAWVHAVESALSAIERGDLQKVVLAREVLVEADRILDLPSALGRLQIGHPSCFAFAAGPWVGATPELLVRRRGEAIESRPVAGTAPPGGARALARSAKELAEHRLVVDAVTEALAPVCAALVVPPGPEVLELANVLHLATPVTGHLRADRPTALALAARLHPTPAVGGSPTAAALDSIRALEGMERGCYAGPVGWVDASGDGEWAVALRCAEVLGNSARLFAGAGIVAGSDPESEWAETQSKLEAMLVALIRP
ncbi:MAG: isochorismate synthase [Actinobacteria bacterium]|nr:isochorismate synthase [Actinomycetota bacterium]